MTDIKELLLAYGQWCRDDGNNLSCKSPSAMLMKSAPHLCKDSKPPKSSTTLFITDDRAMMVDRVMGDLVRYSVLLWRIVVLHYVHGNSIRGITDYLNKVTEGERFTRISVGKLIERAHGFVEAKLLDMAAAKG